MSEIKIVHRQPGTPLNAGDAKSGAFFRELPCVGELVMIG